jgi:uncharacterized protein YbjT (DUF2867 family)
MRVVLFGATGMVGQGVLRECLRDCGVESVLSIGRSPTGTRDAKLRELVRSDLWDYSDVEAELAGVDACFFCLGVASSGMAEEQYEKITYGITLAAAGVLARLNPRMTFVYVSGMGADSSEQGRVMWARVRGRTENALLRLPFAAYVFRPGFIQPLDGIQSRTKLYRVLYKVVAPVMPLLRAAFPKFVLTTEEIGRAMLVVARKGWTKRVLEVRDIRAVVEAWKSES